MNKRVYSGIRTKGAEPFYFDDCLVCQATRKADEQGKDLNLEEMREVFRKANESD